MSGPIHANQQQSRHTAADQQKQQIVQRLKDLGWGPNLSADHPNMSTMRQLHRQTLFALQRRDNLDLRAQARQVLPAAEAQQAAPGAPVQALPAAQETFKQRRERQRQERSARRHTPVGTHMSYILREQVEQFLRQQQAACSGKWEAQLRSQNIDPADLRGFLTVCDKHAPSEEKKRTEQANLTLINGFLSSDPATHDNVLRGFVQDIFRIRLTPDMLQEDYVTNHLPEMLALSAKLTSINQLYTNPAHARFFQSLSPEDDSLLRCHCAEAAALRTLLQSYLGAKGVNLDGTYESDANACAAAAQQQAANVGSFQRLLQRTDAELALSSEALTQVAARQLSAQAKAEKNTPEIQELNLTGYIDEQNIKPLADIHQLIIRYPDLYFSQQSVLDPLYEQLYRATDAISDTVLEVTAAKKVINEQGEAAPLSLYAIQKAAGLQEQLEQMQRQQNGIYSLMRLLLRQPAKLTAEGRLLAKRKNLLAQAEYLEKILADEELWRTDPDALIARVQGKLDGLQFSPDSFASKGVQPKTFFLTYQFAPQFQVPHIDEITNRILTALQADPQVSPGLDQPLTAPDGNCIADMGPTRLIHMLCKMTAPQINEQAIQDTVSKLLSMSRYHQLESKHSRTPDEQRELDGYNYPPQTAILLRNFRQGLQQLKDWQLQHLRGMEQKYGLFLSQLHPEDLLARCGADLANDFSLQQDYLDLCKGGKEFMDPQRSEQDKEIVARTTYCANSLMVAQAYFSSDRDLSNAAFQPDPFVLQAFSRSHPNVRTALEYESRVGGARFNSVEMKAYQEIVRRRFANGQTDRLIGRFAPEDNEE